MPLESPEASAQAVLAQARAESAAAKNKVARAVPPFYRFDELRGFERWQQAALLHKAFARADRELPVIAACLAWLAILGIVVYLLPESALSGAKPVLLPIGLGLPFALFRRWRVRHHVRQEIAAMERGGTPE